jgi:hypothetical protein
MMYDYRQLTAKPFAETRGHTGYLTFGVLASHQLDESDSSRTIPSVPIQASVTAHSEQPSSAGLD